MGCLEIVSKRLEALLEVSLTFALNLEAHLIQWTHLLFPSLQSTQNLCFLNNHSIHQNCGSLCGSSSPPGVL